MKRRKLELAVISDVHLGTYGCRAEEVLHYLKSIRPKTLILNGDIIDVWQFKKKYWPSSHTKVLKEVLNLASKGTQIYFLPGNHDEVFRRFVGYKVGNIHIENKVVLNLDGKKAWFFHGDVFDVTMQHSRWLTKLGSVSYDLLIWLNYKVNRVLTLFGREKISFSKKVKNGVKSAVKYINQFERICADIAIDKSYDYVVCGHIHQPEIRRIENKKGVTTYLNSGDWVENLSALEYNKKEWSIVYTAITASEMKGPDEYGEMDQKALFQAMLEEFQIDMAQS
ncbi:MAG: UDP-2,3-diacylglucosamine diphosphatase [Bacteroidia bacterium]|nr:UDP-2,3-diacylglucosamine diphosphatase [Bacteroidia bacterium]